MSEKSRSTPTLCDHEALPDLDYIDWRGRRCWFCGRLINVMPRFEWDGERWVSVVRYRHRTDELAREEGDVCVDAPLPEQPNVTVPTDRWLCTSCGAERLYRRTPERHGGPSRRAIDRRYGWTYCSRQECNPQHTKSFQGQIVEKWRSPSLWRHESAPNPEQPVQDDPSLAPFLPAPKAKRKAA